MKKKNKIKKFLRIIIFAKLLIIKLKKNLLNLIFNFLKSLFIFLLKKNNF